MTLKKDEAIQNILADYEKLANLVLTQLDEVKKLISSGKLDLDEAPLDALKKNESKQSSNKSANNSKAR